MAERFYQDFLNSQSKMQVSKEIKPNMHNFSQTSEGRSRQGSYDFDFQKKRSPLNQKYQQYKKSQLTQILPGDRSTQMKNSNQKNAKYGFLRRTVNSTQMNHFQQYEGLGKNIEHYVSKKSIKLKPELGNYNSQMTNLSQKYPQYKNYNESTESSSNNRRDAETRYKKIGEQNKKDAQIDYATFAVSPRQRRNAKEQYNYSNANFNQSYQQKQKPYSWLKYEKYDPSPKNQQYKLTKTYDFERKYDTDSVNFTKKTTYNIEDDKQRLQADNYGKSFLRSSLKSQNQPACYTPKPTSLATTNYQRQTQSSSPDFKYKNSPSTPQANAKHSPTKIQTKVAKKVQQPRELDLEMISIALEKLSLKTSIKSESKKLSLDDFKILKQLGQGRFGSVSLAVHKKTNFLFALKKVKKTQIKDHGLQNQFSVEIGLQLQFNHKNILSLYGFFDDQQFIYLILEYMQGGNLYGQLKKTKKMSQQMASRRMKEILSAINYLHQSKIAHRDLKPQNIVISNGTCKLCDFGSCALFDEQRRRTLIGSPDYVPTQVLNGQEYGLQIDQWCLGVLCYELLVGKTPFYHVKLKQTMQKIREADTDKIIYPNQMSAEAKDFIKKLIVKNPEQRMSIQKALDHKFIKFHKEQQIV